MFQFDEQGIFWERRGAKPLWQEWNQYGVESENQPKDAQPERQWRPGRHRFRINDPGHLEEAVFQVRAELFRRHWGSNGAVLSDPWGENWIGGLCVFRKLHRIEPLKVVEDSAELPGELLLLLRGQCQRCELGDLADFLDAEGAHADPISRTSACATTFSSTKALAWNTQNCFLRLARVDSITNWSPGTTCLRNFALLTPA